MSQLRTIFETCRPRPDVQAGTTKDEQFAADLAQVVNNTAPKEYADPAVFLQASPPDAGIRELLKAVLIRLAGQGARSPRSSGWIPSTAAARLIASFAWSTRSGDDRCEGNRRVR